MAKLVAESCFDLLHLEMVDLIASQFQLDEDTKSQNYGKAAAKLEAIGFQVGGRLAERYSKDQLFFVEQLDIIKFICKDFWIALFRKQVDKLQTNYKGIYVLHDFQFRWLYRVSCADNVGEKAKIYTSFACGVIRGALSNLGINCSVKADINRLPGCQFTLMDLDRRRSRHHSSSAAVNTSAPPTSTTTNSSVGSVPSTMSVASASPADASHHQRQPSAPSSYFAAASSTALPGSGHLK